jgi:hypothetical protein
MLLIGDEEYSQYASKELDVLSDGAMSPQSLRAQHLDAHGPTERG